jgi:hypothetical protein
MAGRLLEQFLVPVRVAIPQDVVYSRRGVRDAAQRLMAMAGNAILAAADSRASEVIAEVTSNLGPALERAHRREASLLRLISRDTGLIQPGLFDSRALTDQHRDRRRRLDVESDIHQRIIALAGSSRPRLAALEPVLLLFVLRG